MLEVVTDDLLLRSFLLFRETARNARRALDSFDLSECFGALRCRDTKAPAGCSLESIIISDDPPVQNAEKYSKVGRKYVYENIY